MSDIKNEIPVGSWCWCLQCQRCYKKGEHRTIKMRKNSAAYKFAVQEGFEPEYHLCPYQDCDGDTLLDCYAWVETYAGQPKEPERNVAYPMFPAADS